VVRACVIADLRSIDRRIARSMQPIRASAAASHRSRAFTMLELIVVVLLIAVLGGLIMPRLFGSDRREAERECEDVRRLLSVAANRSVVSGQSVLVKYDSQARKIDAFVLREVSSSDGVRNEWWSDIMIPGVFLDKLSFRRGTSDVQALSTGSWSIEFTTAEPRPLLWLAFSATNEPEASGWQVELLPEETGASRRRMNQTSRATSAGLFRIDLDAVGQGERAW